MIDTNIILYARFSNGTKDFYRYSKELLSEIRKGKVRGIMPVPVLVEVYQKLLTIFPEDMAKARLKDVVSMANMEICRLESDHIEFAGKTFFDSNYYRDGDCWKRWRDSDATRKTLSTVDSMVLSMAKLIEGAVVCTYDGHMLESDSELARTAEDLVVYMSGF